VPRGKPQQGTLPLSLLFSFLFFLVTGFCSYCQGISPKTSFTPDQKEVIGTVNLLALYSVEGGRSRTVAFEREHLESGDALEVGGYVSGVVVLCNDELEACLDGDAMSRIRENEDGSLSCKYFGRLDAGRLIFPYIGSHGIAQSIGKDEREVKSSRVLLGGYSYFPKVVGSSVSRAAEFCITLRNGAASVRIPVKQQACRTIFEYKPGTREEVSFQYQGNSLADHFNEGTSLLERLTAVSEGVRSVEERFDVDLVRRVSLVDYEKIRNAVTCKDENEIWFYMRALREEPLEELRTIAAHETLHLLVDRLGFADNNEVRELFADLKGFPVFSYERSMLLVRGTVLDGPESDFAEDSVFFSFINEQNFQEGMKGGHSHQNPDEFCASFLHSVMYVERLRGNLERSILARGRRPPHNLTSSEKRDILRNYLRTLDVLKGFLSGAENPMSARMLHVLDRAALFTGTNRVKSRRQGVTGPLWLRKEAPSTPGG